VTARDVRYGRQGGRWAPPPSTAVDKPRRGGPVDTSNRSHPDVIARDRAHRDGDQVCPARKDAQAACTCKPDPADLAAVWQGRARMAAARRQARVMLDAVDRQALDRYPPGVPA
jgi:hypothetical protein